MKMPILVGLCAAVLLGVAETRAADDMPESIACAQETGEALGQCTYRIKRNENGKTTVIVAFSNGFKRKLFFEGGKFLKGSVTMSGVGTDTDWSVEDGMHRVRVDDQRYAVPDSLIVD